MFTSTTAPRPIADNNANWDKPDDDSGTGSPPPAHIDSPLESLGKAIAEPVWDAAGEAGDARQPAPKQRK